MMSKNAMKICFILPNLGAGGAERVVTILSGAMVRRGVMVDIMMLLTDRVQYQVPEGVSLVALNTAKMSQIQRFRCLRNYFKEQKKHCGKVVAVPFQDNCLQYALAATAGLGIPVIGCERNDPYQKGRSGWARFRARLPYVLASRCVFQTMDARDYYGKSVGKKSTVIVNPLVLSQSLNWTGQNSRQILSVGRLEPQKNQKILIDAFARIHQNHPDYTLEIYGEGALRQQLQAQIDALGLTDTVFLRGYASDIHEKLARSAMFVLPSDYEGMSNALIEALAIGVPTVTTDHPIGGARMLIEDGVNGLLTPVGDVQGLCDAMERLMLAPELARTLSRNGISLRHRLAVDEIVEQWFDIIQN